MLRVLFLIFVLVSLPAAADMPAPRLDFRYSVLIKNDVELLKKAHAQSEKSNWEKAAKIARMANDKIVYDIIKWMEFKNAKSPSKTEIIAFLNAHPNWPMQDTLKKRVGLLPRSSSKKKEWRRLAEKARDLIEEKKYDKAYKTIKGKHKRFKGAQKADALWLSGWINLRFLKNPRKAAEYFKELHRNVGYPISLSRAQYWTGRAYEDMGDNQKSRFWYREASRHDTTFYGQMAAAKTNPNHSLDLPFHPAPDVLDAKNFILDNRIRAARILDSIDDHDHARLFLIRYLGEKERSVQDYDLVVLLAQQTINYEWAVLAGKKAAQQQVLIPQANYPVLKFTPPTPEKSLVMAITRQESQLNRYAKSPVGARGMMQLMPGTAKSVAKELGVVYSQNRLFDKDYNMRLGSHYINKRIKDFNGSYILAIASYNAGIGNALKWVKRFGDPRKMKTIEEIIDWMEMIPFSETRNYVQRVLETTQVYRARLGGGRHRLEIIDDLRRGR